MVCGFRGYWVAALGLALLAGCGGKENAFVGGAGAGGNNPGGNSQTGGAYTAGVFPAAESFANKCQAPRSGTDPATGRAYPDQLGTSLDEKNFLRSWTHDTYLWFLEVPDTNPASTPEVLDYFDTLKTPEILPSGRAKDQFHFTYDSAEWYALSESGVSVGYGLAWMLIDAAPPRRLVVLNVQPDSVAANAGIERGAEILAIDGVDFVFDNSEGAIASLNEALDPADGDAHVFTFLKRDGLTQATANLTAAPVTMDPVPTVKVLTTDTGDKVGYIQFDDHIATAEMQLIAAVEQFKQAEITDLVLDLRYNGGGYLDLASELAYMIAGDARTDGKVFETQTFNNPDRNPVTGDPVEPTPFRSESGFSAPFVPQLPTLDLGRVYVLTTAATCSASEAVINSLNGIDVEVIQIGGDTCGKPYGFYPQDNCGTTYFSIQFKGVNDKGFGDYAEGFSPVARVGLPEGAKLPGCEVADDYAHDLGDENESMLKVAMAYRIDGANACALAPADAGLGLRRVTSVSALPGANKKPWRENRILQR